jgi:hypothetical protein
VCTRWPVGFTESSRQPQVARIGLAISRRCSAERRLAIRCRSTWAAAADLTIGLRVDTGPTGNARLTPTFGVELSAADARVEARADLFQVDLVTGATNALPQLGLWAAAGRPGAGHRVLDITNPTVARADTLRIGFALDAQRRLTFVLAADGVLLGTHSYPTLDLTSPDAVMDAVGNTVSDVASQLLGNLGDSLTVARLLLGLDPPAGVSGITLPALMADPVAAVSGYWRNLIAAPPATVSSVLATVRDALADASEAASAIHGTGVALDPWRVPLIGPLELEVAANGSVLSVGVAASTSVDTLGQRCTVVETRIAATIAEIDLAANTASLLPGVEGVLSARERGVSPPRVRLPLADGAVLTASGVGLRLGWTPRKGLAADVQAPNLTLAAGNVQLPIALPVIAADGTVTLPPDAWDGVEGLVGYLGELIGGPLGDIVTALGWSTDVPVAGGDLATVARLPLRDLAVNPANALTTWLPRLVMSDLGPKALEVVADLFAGSGASRGLIEGTGHPDDPYRFALADSLPNAAVWFPPAGLERRIIAAPEALRRWRPGDPGLSPAALAAALQAEAEVATDIAALVEDRDIAGSLSALTQRWIGGDGRIVPPETAPAGVLIDRTGVAAGQLLSHLDLEDLTGRVPTTTVYVALGTAAWPDAPAARRVDLTTPRLDASMFAPPSAAPGDWFVALGSRADCQLSGSSTDGTPEQASRLARVLDALATISSDIALVAVGGAGHAARRAADAQSAVTDLITLGTPLGPVSLTAINTQPTADALRLLHRLLSSLPAAADDEPEDEDLALGRGLVGAMMELVDRADPTADLRVAAVPPPTPRAGLSVTASFGVVTESQIGRAMTAIVATGLAERARIRAATPLPDATGVSAGMRLVVAPTTSGTLSVSGDALLTLLSYDNTTGIDTGRHLRVRLKVRDRVGWLSATPDLELRMVTADVSLPLDGDAHGVGTITLHDARVFGQSWERLVLGTGPGAVPVLPEARVLLAAAVQRIATDAAGTASVALRQLLAALGVVDPAGGVAGDAVDQLIHDPGGLLRQRLAAANADITSAVESLLGPMAAAVDLDARSVRIQGGSETSGRFGWHADLTASPTGLSGQLRIGVDAPSPPTGGLALVVDLAPFHASLRWHQPSGSVDTVTLWPAPDAAAIARTIAQAAPSLGGHAALELMRRADESARPVIDAALDAMGMLSGAVSDANRSLRPLAGLLSDPAGWLRSADSLASNPAKIQALFDALRPLLGVGGAPGSPIPLANGVTLGAVAAGAGARLTLDVNPALWTAPGNATGRLAAGLGATLTVGPSGPPAFGLDVHVGQTGADPGRQAVHARLGAGGIEVFLRPATGADIPLIPFSGLGSLAAAAEAALPFLLDRLAEIPGTVGTLVHTIGDALVLRAGMPKKFDGAALHAWSVNPVGALTSAVPSITATGLTTLAPLLDQFVPAAVTVTATTNTLSVAIADVSLAWNPSTGVVTLTGDGVDVPGIDQVSFSRCVERRRIERAGDHDRTCRDQCRWRHPASVRDRGGWFESGWRTSRGGRHGTRRHASVRRPLADRHPPVRLCCQRRNAGDRGRCHGSAAGRASDRRNHRRPRDCGRDGAGAGPGSARHVGRRDQRTQPAARRGAPGRRQSGHARQWPLRSVDAPRARPQAIHQHRSGRYRNHVRRAEAVVRHGEQHDWVEGRADRSSRAHQRRRHVVARERRCVDREQSAPEKRAVRRFPADRAAAHVLAEPHRLRCRSPHRQELRPASRFRNLARIDRPARLRRDRCDRREGWRRRAAVLEPRRLDRRRHRRQRHRAGDHARHGADAATARVFTRARDPEARQWAGSRHAARRRRRGAVVDRHPKGVWPALSRADWLRRDDAERPRRAHLAADGRLGVDVRPDVRRR